MHCRFYSMKLEDVKLPKANLLPGEFDPLLDSSRVALASMAVGVAKAAFEYSSDYAKDRDVFRSEGCPKTIHRFYACRNGDRN